MNKINIDIDCGIITLSLEARTNDVWTVDKEINKFLKLAETIWEQPNE